MSYILWLYNPVFTCIRQNIKLSLVKLHSFKYVILILWKEKYILGRIDLYFGGFGEKLDFFLGIWGAMQNNFTEPRKLFFQIWGDQ